MKAQEDSQRFKTVQDGSKRLKKFKKIHEGSGRHEGCSIKFKKVQGGVGRFKKVHDGSRRLQKGSRRLK